MKGSSQSQTRILHSITYLPQILTFSQITWQLGLVSIFTIPYALMFWCEHILPFCSNSLLSGRGVRRYFRRSLDFWLSYQPHCNVGLADGKYNNEHLDSLNPSNHLILF